MNKKKKSKLIKFLTNPWTVGIGLVIFGAFLNGKFKWINFSKIFEIIKVGLSYIGKFFIYKVGLPVWLLMIISIPFIFFFGIMITYYFKKNPENKFLNYTEDKFDNIIFRWEWKDIYKTGKYDVYDLHKHCPKCKCILNSKSLYSPGRSTRTSELWYCPNCEYKIGDNEIPNEKDIIALISHRAENKC